MVKKNLTLILIVMLALLLIIVVIVIFNKRIRNLDRHIGPVSYQVKSISPGTYQGVTALPAAQFS